MKKLTSAQRDELHQFIGILTKYLVGVGGIKNSPLVNVQSQEIDDVNTWTWFKMGFHFTCGFGFAIWVGIMIDKIIHFTFGL